MANREIIVKWEENMGRKVGWIASEKLHSDERAANNHAVYLKQFMDIRNVRTVPVDR